MQTLYNSEAASKKANDCTVLHLQLMNTSIPRITPQGAPSEN